MPGSPSYARDDVIYVAPNRHKSVGKLCKTNKNQQKNQESTALHTRAKFFKVAEGLYKSTPFQFVV